MHTSRVSHSTDTAVMVETKVHWQPLIDRLKSGENRAWTVFVHEYQPRIRRWLLSLGAVAQEIDDLTQDVLATVHTRLSGFQHTGQLGAFRRWVRNLVHNRWDTYRRDQTQRTAHQLESSFSQWPTACDRIRQLEEREQVSHATKRCLDHLRKMFHAQSIEIFCQTVINGRPSSEVARDLNISHVAVRVAKSRVLRAFVELYPRFA